MAYLSTSPCLIHPSVPEDQLRLRIVKGYHGLHLYAIEFWTEHLLQYAKSQSGLDPTVSAPLIEQLQRLLGFRRESQTAEFATEQLAMGASLPIETCTSALKDLPNIESLVKDVLMYRQILGQEKHTQKDPEGE